MNLAQPSSSLSSLTPLSLQLTLELDHPGPAVELSGRAEPVSALPCNQRPGPPLSPPPCYSEKPGSLSAPGNVNRTTVLPDGLLAFLSFSLSVFSFKLESHDEITENANPKLPISLAFVCVLCVCVGGGS